MSKCYLCGSERNKVIHEGVRGIPRIGYERKSMRNVIKNYTRTDIRDLLETWGFSVDLYSVDEPQIEKGEVHHDFYRVLARKK